MNKEQRKEEFLNLIQENRKIIFKICNSYCKNKDDREDLAQEIVYQLWKSFIGFNPDYKFSTWMYRIALNVAISFYRKDKKSRNTISIDEHVIEIEDIIYDSNESGKNLNLLQRFINELKELDRALMILYLEEKNYKEISDILGISETNVATKISRIKFKLKQKFTNINN
ncbi:MAG: sigma-70 family RNA polymerase sigma factor [Bacteroidota bacterium]|nr:sigma-70 family RNA polymerase sigma factor [Bacteroidota bacterium]